MPEGETPQPMPQQPEGRQQPTPEQAAQQIVPTPEAAQKEAEAQTTGEALDQQLDAAGDSSQKIGEILREFGSGDKFSSNETASAADGDAGPENAKNAQSENSSDNQKTFNSTDEVLDAYSKGEISKADMETQMKDLANSPKSETGQADTADADTTLTTEDFENEKSEADVPEDIVDRNSQEQTEQNIQDTKTKIEQDYIDGKLNQADYKAKMAELANTGLYAVQNPSTDVRPGEQYQDMNESNYQEPSAEQREQGQKVTPTNENVPSPEMTEGQKEAIAKMDKQLETAGVDPQSELGTKVKDFLLQNPDKAVVINQLITKLTRPFPNPINNALDINQLAQTELTDFKKEMAGENDPIRRKVLEALLAILQAIAAELVKIAAATGKDMAKA